MSTEEVKFEDRVSVKKGIVLPWERKERYGNEILCPDHYGPPRAGTPMYPDRQPTGTVIESGTVWIDIADLSALADQGSWDSQFGTALLLGYHEGLALVKAGFAVEETRGGHHGTEKLLDWMKENNLL